MKSRFLSAISHELRTPLNLIVGLSGMVIRDSDEGELLLPEAARRDLERIHAYSQHLGGLIGDVIDLATSGVGQLRLNNENINMAEVLRMVADSGSQLAADKGLAWEATLPETGPWVWGDQTRLRQVALNLINNAIKFTPPAVCACVLKITATPFAFKWSTQGWEFLRKSSRRSLTSSGSPNAL
jgi:signal transduction histidine kinase